MEQNLLTEEIAQYAAKSSGRFNLQIRDGSKYISDEQGTAGDTSNADIVFVFLMRIPVCL